MSDRSFLVMRFRFGVPWREFVGAMRCDRVFPIFCSDSNWSQQFSIFLGDDLQSSLYSSFSSFDYLHSKREIPSPLDSL